MGSGGSSHNAKLPLALASSTALPGGLYPTRVYGAVGDRGTRGTHTRDDTRFALADLKAAGIVGNPVICSGWGQQTKHQDGRFDEDSMGVIAQLSGSSCYAMYGDKVTLLIGRDAGDVMWFDAAWAEGQRALTFEDGLVRSRLRSSQQAGNPHAVVCVGPPLARSAASSGNVFELKDPEHWGQVQPLHAAVPCLSETSDFHSG